MDVLDMIQYAVFSFFFKFWFGFQFIKHLSRCFILSLLFFSSMCLGLLKYENALKQQLPIKSMNLNRALSNLCVYLCVCRFIECPPCLTFAHFLTSLFLKRITFLIIISHMLMVVKTHQILFQFILTEGQLLVYTKNVFSSFSLYIPVFPIRLLFLRL